MAAGFDSWRSAARDIVPESDWQRCCPYSSQSPALLLPSTADAAQLTILPLFGTASASPSGSRHAASDVGSGSGGPSTAAPAGDSGGDHKLSKAEATDVLLNAGGPVWAMDWCPAGTQAAGSGAAGAAGAAPSYLAVGSHPLEAQQNTIGKAVHGPACIQIWELDHPDKQPEPQPQPCPAGQQGQPDQQQTRQQQQQQPEQRQQQPEGPQLPRMVLALAHDGGVTFNCRWCPDPGLTDDPSMAVAGGVMPRLGLLAAVLGDGSLRVWAIPHPRAALPAWQQQQVPAAASPLLQPPSPLVLSLAPVAAARSAALGGSMPSVVDWLPAAPHDLLAVGCWDGSVALFRLAPGRQQQQQQVGVWPANDGHGAAGSSLSEAGSSMYGLELLTHFSADALPLRALRWAPPDACRSAIDGLERQLIVTGGHEGTLRVWDLRDPFQAIYSHVLSGSATILAAEWTSRPFGITVAMEDASLRGLVLDSDVIERCTRDEKKAMFSISWRGPNMGALWGLAVQPSMQVVAYAGEDGVVGVFPAEYEGYSKRRMTHTALAGMRMEGAALVVKTPAQLAREHGLFAGRVVERQAGLKSARLPEEQEALHRVAWSAHSGGAAWLASAGAAGIVRCQWIQSQ